MQKWFVQRRRALRVYGISGERTSEPSTPLPSMSRTPVQRPYRGDLSKALLKDIGLGPTFGRRVPEYYLHRF